MAVPSVILIRSLLQQQHQLPTFPIGIVYNASPRFLLLLGPLTFLHALARCLPVVSRARRSWSRSAPTSPWGAYTIRPCSARHAIGLGPTAGYTLAPKTEKTGSSMPSAEESWGSPAAREDRLSFLDEITPKQMAGYRPDQIATILRQRENVQAAIELQQLRSDSSEIVTRRPCSTAFKSAPDPLEYRKPWVRAIHEECRYRICSRCRPGLADRAFISLNAVANGEIPPTAAVGFGFHVMGERPVINAEILKNMGRRPASPVKNGESGLDDSVLKAQAPAPQEHPRASPGQASFRSRESIRQLFEDEIDAPATGSGLSIHNHVNRPQHQGSGSDSPGCLKHSSRCGNLGKYSDAKDVSNPPSCRPHPLTPPPSPWPGEGKAKPTEPDQDKLEDKTSLTKKIGSSSTPTNPTIPPKDLKLDSSKTCAVDELEMHWLAVGRASSDTPRPKESTLPAAMTPPPPL
ncbi:hypothetical protein CDD83_1001 [Cordyceps sp. RAO-2017]|nr:hypothetical protein CDD83_1001 [Cordyceps sp. RAO-2017]